MKKELTANEDLKFDQDLFEQSKRVRDFITKNNNRYDPDYLFKDFAEKMDKRYGRKHPNELLKLCTEVLFALGTETHVPTAESVGLEFRHFITELIQCIEKEYSCTTAIEKSLAEIIALSHIRIICLSKTMDGYVTGRISINDDINDYFANISKDLDRAHRQMINATVTLKQLKTPQIPFNINANTAFVSNNQQINDYSKER